MSTILGIAAVPVAFGIALAVLFVRRFILTRSGTVAMAIRIYRRVPGRGWAPGFAKYEQGRLQWYRMFSYAPRPRVVLDRSDLKVEERREPVDAERQIFPPSVVILCCQAPAGEVEIAMTRSALTGFLSWLEAAPPGAASRFYRGD
ncbi:DUF2550 domain-containing protein [Stackebrandtia soli]|uniref:DUF2550 domain-containing protein n=1 Tax=Stackebrandtia soli TaxID=1892856 RepID=UPI0039E86514